MTEIVVSTEELDSWGCPHCGYRSGYAHISFGNTHLWTCSECRETSIALTGGSQQTASFNDHGPLSIQSHPRKGTPSHGTPDKRPEGGGEFFWVRGIGTDNTPGCFICGGQSELHSNIAAFVQCKEAGERIVQMFKAGARLDYRDSEPDRVQVKIGSCEEHLGDLRRLADDASKEKRITKEMLVSAPRGE